MMLSVLTLLVASSTPAPASVISKRPFAAADINAVTRLSSLRLSPDGRTALVVERSLAPDKSRWSQKLVRLDVATMRRTDVADGAGASSPAWSPRGTRFAYLRADAGGVPQLFVGTTASGPPRRLTNLPGGVGAYRWSHDGARIVVTSGTAPAGQPAPARPAGVHVVTRALFRTEGSYVDENRHPDQLWLVDADPEGQAPRQLTSGDRSAALVGWTAGDRGIVYSVDETDESYYGGGTSSLFQIDVAGGQPSRLLALKDAAGKDMATAPAFAISPDGRRLAWVAGATDAPYAYAQPDAYVLDIGTGVVTNATRDFDRDVDNLAWRDDRRLVVTADREATTNVAEVDIATGAARWLTRGRQSVTEFAVTTDRGGPAVLLAIASTPMQPLEIARISPAGDAVARTDVNLALRDRLDLTPPEDVRFTASDGIVVHALLQTPPGFDPRRKYPMIVWNHGGPFWMWSADFNVELLTLAGAGYLVLYPNPRGSQGYGQAFASPLEAKWPGGRDYQDMLEAVDTVAKRPYVDASKIGIGGGSAGAIMTDWAISHTTRFAAAVSISTIVDFDAMWYLGDQPYLGPDSQRPMPGKGGSDSALALAGQVRTPTLYISGERDYRTPSAAGSELMFRALKLYRVPTAMVSFDTAGHSIRQSDYPDHPVLKMRYAVRWFDRYLKGMTIPEFDGADPPPR